MLVLLNKLPVCGSLTLLVTRHTVTVEYTFATTTDFFDALHGVEGFGDEVTRVTGGNVAARREGESGVDNHLFSGGFAEGFGPFELAGVTWREVKSAWCSRCLRD